MELENKYQSMLDVAIDEALTGLSEGGIPIGAAMFDSSGALLSRGHNRRIQENDPSVHAETDAFRKAGRQLLLCDWTTAADDYGTVQASVTVSIGGSDLITLQRGAAGKLESATATVEFAPGLYEYSITYLPGYNATSGSYQQKLTDQITLKMRAQDDLSPRTLGAEDFSVRK